MLSIIAVKPMENLHCWVQFNDGYCGLFDVKPYIKSEYFKELLNPEYFANVRIFMHGIGWQNGQDFSPDTIYMECRPV